MIYSIKRLRMLALLMGLLYLFSYACAFAQPLTITNNSDCVIIAGNTYYINRIVNETNIFFIYINNQYQELPVSQAETIDVPNRELNFNQSIRSWNKKDGYQYLLFGSFPQDNGYDEPILWRVLYMRNNRILLLSEFILNTMPFDSYTNKWTASNANAWLNGDFYNTAFKTTIERNCIIPDREAGSVILLTKSDLLNGDFGFSTSSATKDSNRRASGTFYALNHGLWTKNQCGAYYSRTTSNSTSLVMVRSTGDIGSARITRDNVGIRPAIWLDLDKATFDFGLGTKEVPFQQVVQPY